MTEHLKILILEDKASDADLVKLQLEELEFQCEFEVTDKKEEYITLLNTYHPDIIISDFNLPRFDGMKALAILRTTDDLTPFIFVTGTMGEENAVEAIRSGATDFIIKQRVEQLPSAVIRALRERTEKQTKKEIAKKLADSEQNYKNLFHLSPLPMWVYELDTHKFLKVNEAAIKHYGYSLEEFQSLTIKDIRPEEDIPFIEEALIKTRDKDELFLGVFRHKKKNGEVINVEIQSAYIDLDGTKSRVVVANDITEQLKAEESRKRSEQRFKALVQEGSDLIGIVDIEGNYIFASDSTSKVLGIPPEFFIGKNGFDFIHPEDIPRVSEQFASLNKMKQVKIEAFRFQDSDNQWRWLESTATNLSDDPAVGGIVINSRDITKNVQQEQKLKLTNERYRLVALATNDAIYDWDIKTGSIIWGEGINTLFGHPWSGKETSVDNWSYYAHPDEYQMIREDLEKKLAQPASNQWRKEFRLLKADGEFAHVLQRGYIIRDQKGKAIRMIGAVSDVSESVERETGQRLLAALSHTLGKPGSIHEQLNVILELLKDHIGLDYAEAWLTNINHTKLNMVAQVYPDKPGKSFAAKTKEFRETFKGKGFPGEVWKSKKVLVWPEINKKINFIRRKEAFAAGIISAIGTPVIFNNEVIGTFIFFNKDPKKKLAPYKNLLVNISTRLGAELQRKKSEEELDRFFTLSPDLLCIIGLDGYFKKINSAFSKLLGYSEDEILATPFIELIHPEDRNETKWEVKNLNKGLTTFDFESRCVCKDDGIVWVSWTISPLPEEELLFAVAKDITERKKVEFQLINRNQQLKTAQQVAKLGYWVHHLDTDRGDWSEEIYSIWELDPSEFVVTFENYLKTIFPEDRHLFMIPPEELPANEFREVEHRILTPEGKLKWVFQRINLIQDTDGNPLRFEGVAQDITEKKKLEKEREAILESITDGFFAVDNNWIVTYWNKAAEEILQIPKESILNNNLWEVPLVKLKSYDEYYRALVNQEVRVFETHYPSMGIWVEISIFPKRDGLTVYVKDISERKQHQHAIFKTIQETQERERTRFGRDMHDGLTQSLSAIKMNLTYFKDKLEQGEANMDIFNKALSYINNSINESRTISHGLLSVTFESYGLLRALEEVVENVNANKQLHVTFNHNFPEEQILTKELEVNIYRIVQEAIQNILKHSKATEAEIVLILGTESIQLIINDNGVGIDELNNNGHTKGAGLSNIKVRSEVFDGKLIVVNKEEQGLQLHITFPFRSDLSLGPQTVRKDQ